MFEQLPTLFLIIINHYDLEFYDLEPSSSWHTQMLLFHHACYAIDFDPPGMDRAKWLRCYWPVAIPSGREHRGSLGPGRPGDGNSDGKCLVMIYKAY